MPGFRHISRSRPVIRRPSQGPIRRLSRARIRRSKTLTARRIRVRDNIHLRATTRINDRSWITFRPPSEERARLTAGVLVLLLCRWLQLMSFRAPGMDSTTPTSIPASTPAIAPASIPTVVKTTAADRAEATGLHTLAHPSPARPVADLNASAFALRRTTEARTRPPAIVPPLATIKTMTTISPPPVSTISSYTIRTLDRIPQYRAGRPMHDTRHHGHMCGYAYIATANALIRILSKRPCSQKRQRQHQAQHQGGAEFT